MNLTEFISFIIFTNIIGGIHLCLGQLFVKGRVSADIGNQVLQKEIRYLSRVDYCYDLSIKAGKIEKEGEELNLFDKLVQKVSKEERADAFQEILNAKKDKNADKKDKRDYGYYIVMTQTVKSSVKANQCLLDHAFDEKGKCKLHNDDVLMYMKLKAIEYALVFMNCYYGENVKIDGNDTTGPPLKANTCLKVGQFLGWIAIRDNNKLRGENTTIIDTFKKYIATLGETYFKDYANKKDKFEENSLTSTEFNKKFWKEIYRTFKESDTMNKLNKHFTNILNFSPDNITEEMFVQEYTKYHKIQRLATASMIYVTRDNDALYSERFPISETFNPSTTYQSNVIELLMYLMKATAAMKFNFE